MSFSVQLNMEEGRSPIVEGEFDEEIESGIGITKFTPGNSISLGNLKDAAVSGCFELELWRIPSSPSGCESISVYPGSTKDHKEERKRGGNCHWLWACKYCFPFCTLCLVTILILCSIFLPYQVELCLKLHLDEKDIIKRVVNDEGSWEMNISNPNSINVYIYGLAIKAYYGGVLDENLLLIADKMDYHIPAYSAHSSNQTYTFVKNSTAAVSIQTFKGCSMRHQRFIAFDMVTSFEACVHKFVCREIVKESVYRSNCPEDDMVCTKLEIFN